MPITTNSRTLHSHALACWREGNLHRWRFAFVANLVVGQRVDGATLALAQGIKRSVDTVEYYARAAETYLTLCRLFRNDSETRRTLRDLRRELSPGHFSAMGQLWVRYEFSPSEAIDHLATACREGVSISGLRKHVSDMHVAPPPSSEDYRREMARAAHALKAASLGAETDAQARAAISFAKVVKSMAEPGVPRAGAPGAGDIAPTDRRARAMEEYAQRRASAPGAGVGEATEPTEQRAQAAAQAEQGGASPAWLALARNIRDLALQLAQADEAPKPLVMVIEALAEAIGQVLEG